METLKTEVLSIQKRQRPSFNALLCEFATRFAPEVPASKVIAEGRHLLAEFGRARAFAGKNQSSIADNFNILAAMRLNRKELCHSNILAWLLDHRPEAFGTHAQGRAGFRQFLKKLGLPLAHARTDYRVFRESRGGESQLDIVIEAKGKFVIGIENKIDALEGNEQTPREWADLVRRAKRHNIPPSNTWAFFLTPYEEKALSPRFRSISWLSMADVFEAFAGEAEAPTVKLFASHFAASIKREFPPVTTEEGELYEDVP